VVLLNHSFYFIFILAEFLKNHSKSRKNYKIKNPIFLTPHEEINTVNILYDIIYNLVKRFFLLLDICFSSVINFSFYSLIIVKFLWCLSCSKNFMLI
jgi:hypothetical protein